jgi:aspartate aminotransferase
LISRDMERLLGNDLSIRRMWEEGRRLMEKHGAGNVADMTLGNPVADPPAELLRAFAEVAAHPPRDLHRYTPTAGHPEARQRIAAHLAERGLLPGVEWRHVVVTSGASCATNIALRAVLDPGDEVIVIAPYFPDYPSHVRNHGGVPVIVDAGPDFLPDLGAIDRAMGPRTKALIVNHPNNPSGRMYPEQLVRDLAEVVRAAERRLSREIYVVSDEPYREIRYTANPFLSPAAAFERGIMAYSFSKSHSVPGERIGYLALNPACPDAEKLLAAVSLANRILGFTNAPSLFQRVMARCLDSVVDLAAYRSKRDRLYSALRAMGYEVIEPEGTFYLFPRAPGGDDEAFVRRAAQDLLLLVPGGNFGRPGHFRMAYCVDDRTVDLALTRLPPA